MNRPSTSVQIRTCHEPPDIGRIQDEIERELRALQYEERAIFGIRLALEEALVNALQHGNGWDPRKTATVRFLCDARRLWIEIKDEGDGFDPDAVPDPLDPANLERPCGRGILIIQHYMTYVRYFRPGNRVEMVYARSWWFRRWYRFRTWLQRLCTSVRRLRRKKHAQQNFSFARAGNAHAPA